MDIPPFDGDLCGIGDLTTDGQVFLVDDLFREAPVGGFVCFG
jgi:hypothetical protein